MKQASQIVVCLLMNYFVSTAAAAAKPSSPETCFGPETASYGLVYLHGLDEPSMLSEEKAARVVLRRIATEHRIRVALPRSASTCFHKGHGKAMLCWKAEGAQEAASTLASVQKQTGDCLARQKQTLLLGFSNGGWFVNKLLRWCLKTPYQAHMASGAGGTFDSLTPASLQGCGRGFQIIGKQDRYNVDQARRFFTVAKDRGADIQLIEFDGVHELSEVALKQALAELRIVATSK